MDAVARREVAAGLGDTNDGPAGLQLSTGEAVVVEALEIDGRLTGHGHVIEPEFAAETAWIIGHGKTYGTTLRRVESSPKRRSYPRLSAFIRGPMAFKKLAADEHG